MLDENLFVRSWNVDEIEMILKRKSKSLDNNIKLPRCLLILDDIGTFSKQMSLFLEKRIAEIRHMNISVIFSVQVKKYVLPAIRDNCNCIISRGLLKKNILDLLDYCNVSDVDFENIQKNENTGITTIKNNFVKLYRDLSRNYRFFVYYPEGDKDETNEHFKNIYYI